MFADLHLHTFFSDGTYSPEELVSAASAQGLSAMALSDHDTMAGCERARAACETLGIEFLPACELTVEHEDHEIHMLGYGLDASHAALAAAMLKFREARRDRVRQMAARLADAGAPLRSCDVEAMTQLEAPGRPHVGQALVDAGHCKTLDEAFDRFLKRNKPGWAPKCRVSAAEAIGLVHDAGGLAVLAHPALYRFDTAIPALVEAGLDGLECFHSKHSAGATLHYQELAEHHGLLVTGGSDCHGMTKGAPLIGGVKLEWRHLEALRMRLAEFREPRGPIDIVTG